MDAVVTGWAALSRRDRPWRVRRALFCVASSLLSKNEELEDMNPEDVLWLLVDFYHGVLTLQQSGPSVDRLAVVRDGVASLDAFLQRCDTMRLVNSVEMRLWSVDVRARRGLPCLFVPVCANVGVRVCAHMRVCVCVCVCVCAYV
jgi:hypothetical protein